MVSSKQLINVAVLAALLLVSVAAGQVASSNVTVSNNCTSGSGQHLAATKACDVRRLDCMHPITCTTCECLEEYMNCVETSVVADPLLRDSCTQAQSVYSSLLTIAAGSDYETSPLGLSCRALACNRSLNCSCASLPSLTDPPTPQPPATLSPLSTQRPETPAPVLNTPPPLQPTPAPNTTENATIMVITVTIQADFEDFNPYTFIGLIAKVMAIDLDQIVVVSVASGSVVVKLYFADTAGSTRTPRELSNIFVNEIATGTNELTAQFTILSATAAFESVEGVTGLPPSESPSPVPPSTPLPSEQNNSSGEPSIGEDSGDATNSVSLLTVVIIIVCCFVVVAAVSIGVGVFCYKKWKKQQAALASKATEPVGDFEHYKV